MPAPTIPPFSALPLDKNGPHHNAWGLYGPSDSLGTLNRLSNPLVAAAGASEIQTGRRINLDQPLDAQSDLPFFGRQAFVQHAYQKAPRIVNDDVWTFNTQSSSQWDGFRHFGYQKAARFYNNVTLEDIHGISSSEGGKEEGQKIEGQTEDTGTTNNPKKSTVLGIGAWAAQGGIVGRGVLLDYYAWAEKNGVAHQAFETGEGISVEVLKKVAAEQGTELRFGDVLLLRTGYLDAWRRLDRAEILSLRAREVPAFAGVAQNEEMMQFLWETFAAVGGDHPSFEKWPPPKEWSLHEVLLAGWGMPIGELFDLEELGRYCAEIGRWSFFVVSKPNYVPAGVASPPNMVAIF